MWKIEISSAIHQTLKVARNNRLIDTFPKRDGATERLQEVIRLTEDRTFRLRPIKLVQNKGTVVEEFVNSCLVLSTRVLHCSSAVEDPSCTGAVSVESVEAQSLHVRVIWKFGE
ncbi:hypothetical protein TNCV_2458051 [Trichonephila clavipes]|nr:hypothetical protein TNCV_2458051 [Trichonephila clavipes]